jgi:hypothetical protein
MADVQVNQTAPRSGGANWIWALIVVILLAVIGWFAIGQPYFFKEETNVNIGTSSGQSGGSGGQSNPSGTQ